MATAIVKHFVSQRLLSVVFFFTFDSQLVLMVFFGYSSLVGSIVQLFSSPHSGIPRPH